MSASAAANEPSGHEVMLELLRDALRDIETDWRLSNEERVYQLQLFRRVLAKLDDRADGRERK